MHAAVRMQCTQHYERPLLSRHASTHHGSHALLCLASLFVNDKLDKPLCRAVTAQESSSSNVVLGFNKEAVKPTFKEFAADLDDSAMKEASTGGNGNTKGFQSGKRVDESGSAYKTASLTGSPGQAANLNGRVRGKDSIPPFPVMPPPPYDADLSPFIYTCARRRAEPFPRFASRASGPIQLIRAARARSSWQATRPSSMALTRTASRYKISSPPPAHLPRSWLSRAAERPCVALAWCFSSRPSEPSRATTSPSISAPRVARRTSRRLSSSARASPSQMATSGPSSRRRRSAEGMHSHLSPVAVEGRESIASSSSPRSASEFERSHALDCTP